jgi:predicted secreted protein
MSHEYRRPGSCRNNKLHHSHAPGPRVFMEEIIKELEKRNVKFEIEDARK